MYIVAGLIFILIFVMVICKRKENLKFFHPSNIKNWPYYYYTIGSYQLGGQWPPDMYTRMRYYYPGFNTNGQSYWLRPGITYSRWPKGRWVRKNNNYYFISNS